MARDHQRSTCHRSFCAGIELIPAKVKVIDYYRESFQCLACRKEAHFSIEKPAMPQPVIAKSIASPSSVAHVMVQKYQQSMPLYRQEREWKEIGIPLSRATLANWVIRPAEDWLMPLAARLQQRLLEQDVIHADETGVRTFFWTNYAVNPSCLRYWIGLIPPSDIFIRSSAYQCI